MRNTISIAISLSLFSLIHSVEVKGESIVEYKTYKVVGATPEQLFEAITTNSPIGSSGLTATVPGKNSWKFKLNAEGKYLFASLEVNQHITVTLPVWEGSGVAKQCTIDQWNNAIAALRQHEENHKEKYLSLQARVEAEAVSIPPQTTENDLFIELEKIWEQKKKEIEAEQKKYDSDSKYGQNEGVILSPC